MKKLFYLVTAAILLVFMNTRCVSSMPMNEDKEIAEEYQYNADHATQGIDSVVMVSFDGEVYQEVYYTNGDIEVFNIYLEIEDISLRKAYMTYRRTYWNSGEKGKYRAFMQFI